MIYRYSTGCAKERLKGIRDFIKTVLQEHGLSELDISTIVLAVDEVCANLIIHAHRDDNTDKLNIEVSVEPEKLVFNIIDSTEIFNINDYAAPKLEEIIRAQRKGGVGLILVKKIMDKIEVFTQNKHYVCRLTKKRSHQI